MKKVVLILGAGASKVYGYPDGTELVAKICDSLVEARVGNTQAKYIREILFEREKSDSNPEVISHFKDKLFYSEVYSVDAFLKRNKGFIRIGKLTIAQQLLQCENRKSLFEKNPVINGQHWYRKLFNELVDLVEIHELRKGDITIVTFNYDMSLEFYLYNKFKHLLNLSDPVINSIIDKLNIIHIHGHLGYLSFQDPRGRTYGQNTYPDSIMSAASKINIAYETLDQREQHGILVEAQTRMKESDKILFLGFSYHPDNMELLKIDDIDQSRVEIFGTGLGLSQNQLVHIRKNYGNIKKIESKLDIMSLLSEVPIFET